MQFRIPPASSMFPRPLDIHEVNTCLHRLAPMVLGVPLDGVFPRRSRITVAATGEAAAFQTADCRKDSLLTVGDFSLMWFP
jgi:hypothetical protein